ncbi:MAG TPA: 16S rRNA (adenine(1518)-N(6)/adenine(1519)-N(6))-dimethyltransferase RsmA [Vicinamibacterales bacterium]|nr:16S rRNA (adenine(1518)-N(6)/adenine(1519)-N(6))-dimethyltransferase RsmA [Vicinamibacterales bacterium]
MKARKRFGQHFLEAAWVTKLVNAIEPVATDRFIEIGPGRGAITMPLAPRVKQIVAVEVDRDLAADLAARALPNVRVETADVLDVDLGAIARELGAARVVGNLPYNISSPILFRLLETAATTGLLRDATLMLQKEVADRLIAKPGTSEYGVLSLSTALGADVRTLLALPPGAFRPAPKVRSAVVRLTFRPPPPEVRHPKLIIEIVRAVFTQRRKMLSNALAPFATSRGVSAPEALTTAGLDPRRRPETLTLLDVARLADVLAR